MASAVGRSGKVPGSLSEIEEETLPVKGNHNDVVADDGNRAAGRSQGQAPSTMSRIGDGLKVAGSFVQGFVQKRPIVSLLIISLALLIGLAMFSQPIVLPMLMFVAFLFGVAVLVKHAQNSASTAPPVTPVQTNQQTAFNNNYADNMSDAGDAGDNYQA